MSMLAVSTDTHDIECDGCERTIPAGEKAIFGIRSCCGGGCTRVLCRACVHHAAAMMDPELMAAAPLPREPECRMICPECGREHTRGALDPLSRACRCLGCGRSFYFGGTDRAVPPPDATSHGPIEGVGVDDAAASA